MAAEGGFFAVVEEVGLAVFVADEHEASAAEVSGEGIDDGESEVYGYGSVDSVPALLEDFDAGVGGVVLDGDYHGVPGARGLFGGLRDCYALHEDSSGEDGSCGQEES